jgi:hypothetical protein
VKVKVEKGDFKLEVSDEDPEVVRRDNIISSAAFDLFALLDEISAGQGKKAAEAYLDLCRKREEG